MVPCWGSHGRDVPPETQFLLLELVEGVSYAILLPLIDHGAFRATLRPSGSGAKSCVGCVVMSSFTLCSVH
jgi:Raffinose synthase or seed imbibition protein Sip1